MAIYGVKNQHPGIIVSEGPWHSAARITLGKFGNFSGINFLICEVREITLRTSRVFKRIKLSNALLMPLPHFGPDLSRENSLSNFSVFFLD